eukprot:jgi/Psemu1/20946/gm1.20946_g
MPYLSRACGARIFYETKGPFDGIPVLLLAPGGMRSSIQNWDMSPYNPWMRLQSPKQKQIASEGKGKGKGKSFKSFRLIAMDQRFAGRSTGTVKPGDGWHTFLADQLALLDHLGIRGDDRRCHLVGSCIGPSYALQLMANAPERFGRCVMLQPIGLAEHTTEPGEAWEGLNSGAAWNWFDSWAGEQLERDTNTDRAVLHEFYENMFGRGPPPRDFVFSITRQQAAKIQHSLLIFMGKDISHPSETARQISRIAPNTELVEVWRDAGPEKLNAAAAKISSFLLADND